MYIPWYNICHIPHIFCLYRISWILYDIQKCYIAPPVMPYDDFMVWIHILLDDDFMNMNSEFRYRISWHMNSDMNSCICRLGKSWNHIWIQGYRPWRTVTTALARQVPNGCLPRYRFEPAAAWVSVTEPECRRPWYWQITGIRVLGRAAGPPPAWPCQCQWRGPPRLCRVLSLRWTPSRKARQAALARRPSRNLKFY